jgi:CelD/BcsL family acetyltransferase involved in cellulose biosynthesis
MSEFASSVIDAHGSDRGLREKAANPRLHESVECEFIEDSERLHAIRDDWLRLWASLPDGTPFQSPDWLLPWWNHFGEGPLFSFAFWQGGELVGLAPLYIFAGEKIRRVFLIGTGNTDYLDVIFQPDRRKLCVRQLLTAIQEREGLWDECMFQRLRLGSPVLSERGDANGLISEVERQEPCPVVDLSGSGASSMLKNARYYARKLEQGHTFSIEHATAECLDELLTALERVHQSRWEGKGLPSVFSKQRDRSFYRQVAKLFLAAGLLSMYALRIEQQIVDVLYGFQWRNRIYLYLSGFDPAFARMSVGTVLLGHAVQRSIDEGCQCFDFLGGRESYKYRWGAQDQEIFSRVIRKPR